MRFSIIIPAFNAEDRIRKALESVRSQTFTDYELIVVCDSCKDNTVKVAKEYANRVIEVKWHNDGMARNTGLDAAKGDYILFMDDDDWWVHENVLSMIDQKLKDLKEDVDILHFGFFWQNHGVAHPNSNKSGHNGHYVAVWSKCWKRSFIGKTRFPNIYAESDAYFSFELFKKTKKQVDWDVPLYYYNYMRPGSISETKSRGIKI